MLGLKNTEIPTGLRYARQFDLISRCGMGSIKKEESFKYYRDMFNENYHFVVPVENKYIPNYVRKTKTLTFPDRLSQFEVEQIILTRIQEENVLLQNLFHDASKNKNGYITKADLFTILLHLCPKLKYKQFEDILFKCDLDKFTVFFLDTVERQLKNLTFKEKLSPLCDVDKSFRRMYGTNALHRLKLAAMEPTFDLKELLPPSVFEPDGIVLMPQLREALCRIDIRMSDEEFVKFWEKFDKFNVGSIPIKYLFQMLNLQDNGLPMCGIHVGSILKIRAKEIKSSKRPFCEAKLGCLDKPNKMELRQIRAGETSFPITRNHGWKPQGCGGTNEPELGKGIRYLLGLKTLMNSHPKYDAIIDKLCYIFQAPYHAMLVIFHSYDNRNRGKVTIGESMEIFLEYGFSIIWKDFLEFLKRSGCIFDYSFVKYKQLLDKYQNKQELNNVDRAIKLIIQTQYLDIGLKTLTTMSPLEIEQHLIKLLHGPYIKLMEDLQKKSDQNCTVDKETMKLALEKLVLGESIKKDKWEELLPYLEMDKVSGRIPYKKFLYIFSKPNHECKKLCSKPPLEVSTKKPWDTSKYERDPRDLLVLCNIIERLLKRRFHFIDKNYKFNVKAQLSNFKEYEFKQLLESEKVKLTKTELQLVWNVLLVAAPNAKTYQEVMKFMMTKLVKTAHALKVKEKYDSNKGFYDRNIDILKVFKLNKIIENQKKEENINNKINPAIKPVVIEDVSKIIEKIKPLVQEQWEKINCNFIDLDMIGSTTIESYEMKNIFAKYFPQLKEREVTALLIKYDLRHNGRFNYVKFLMEFRLKKNNDSSSCAFDTFTFKVNDEKSNKSYFLSEVREILRRAMLSKWKNLLSTFRKLDVCKLGFLEIDQINTVLNSNNIYLNKSDLYHILTVFDKNMDGKIDYYEFIREILNINLIMVK